LHRLKNLVHLDFSHNELQGVVDTLAYCKSLEILYLGGNPLGRFPQPVTDIISLKRLYLGSTEIRTVPDSIRNLQRLEVLYLGGNLLTRLPENICELSRLSLLYLGDNRLNALPDHMDKLTHLHTLNVHNNNLTTLPQELVELPGLRQLSIRGNPLLTSFVHHQMTAPGPLSLLELCARTIKNHGIKYCDKCLPVDLCNYLDSAKRCNNPACAGVYFTQGVRSVDFVDVCGKDRVPLMKFLCSAHPADEPAVPDDESRMRRVLMDNYQEVSEHNCGEDCKRH